MIRKIENLSYKKIYLILTGIIACQLVVMCLIYGHYKQESNMDELGSYGQANSSESSVVLSKDSENWDYANMWVSSSHIKDYLTVSDNEIFAYGHIYRTLEWDVHPPLFYYILHFVCSLFPNTFSYWYGIVINAAAFIAIEIFLFRLADPIMGRWNALICCLCFGFTTGAFNIFSFIRMYALLTLFTLMYTYYSIRAFQERDSGKAKNKWVIMSAAGLYLGAMTQYIILLYAFIFTLLMCCYYILTKRFRMFLSYGLSMLAAAVMMPVSFPVFFTQLGIGRDQLITTKYPYFLQLRLIISIVMNEMYGITTPVMKTMFLFWIRMCIYALIIIYIVMRFLFRKDQWFITLRGKLRKSGAALLNKLKNYNKAYYVAAAATLLSVLIMAGTLKLFFFSYTADRYLFLLFPMIYMFIFGLLVKIVRIKPIPAVILIMLTFLSVFSGFRNYLGYTDAKGTDTASVLKGSDTVVILESYNNMKRYTKDLYQCNSFFATNANDYDKYIDEMKTGDGRKEYLLIEKTISYLSQDKSMVDEVTEKVRNSSIGDSFEYIGEDSNAYIYRLKD